MRVLVAQPVKSVAITPTPMRVLTGDENIRHSESLRNYKADFLLLLSLSLKDSKDCKSFYLLFFI